MYLSNIIVDGALDTLTKLFDASAHAEGVAVLDGKESVQDADLFSGEPVYWPTNTKLASIGSLRGHGAAAYLRGAGSGMVVMLSANSKYQSVVERDYLTGYKKVVPQPGSVVNDLRGRSFWGNISDNIQAPAVGDGSDAAMQLFVDEGKHVEGVGARVLAFALEHALVPFSSRVRSRKANSCYWCLARYRSDNIQFSLQNAQSASEWASPSRVGVENDPTTVLWVGPADMVYGMALLSRIFDQAGPMYEQRSYLLKQFDVGRLLMVGTGCLSRELPHVQAADLWRAIREAFFILEKYNNLTSGFMARMLHVLVHNLPVVDSGFCKERDMVYWRVRDGTLGVPVIPVDRRPAFEARVEQATGLDFISDVCGHDLNVDLMDGVFSDILRDTILAPGVGLLDHAPPTTVAVTCMVADVLGVSAVAAGAVLVDENVYYCTTDLNLAPVLRGLPPQQVGDYVDVWGVLSGRCPFRLFMYSGPGLDGALPALLAGCIAVGNAADLGLQPHSPLAGDGRWQEWIGGVDVALVPHLLNRTLRAYCVRSWIPIRREQYQAQYIAPPNNLRRWDVPSDYLITITAAGNGPVVDEFAPRAAAYLGEVDVAGTPLQFLSNEGYRAIPVQLSNAQKILLYMRGLAMVWEAVHVGRQQNEAYRRWVAFARAGVQTTVVPDELLLFLGGARVYKAIEPAGGLWSLCYTKDPAVVTSTMKTDGVLSLLRNSPLLASFLLKLRCGVEIGDQLLRISNARVVGCRAAYLYNEHVDARLARAGAEQAVQVSPAEYFSQQNLVLNGILSSSHGSMMDDFGLQAVGGLRLRDPSHTMCDDIGLIQRLNWVIPQILSNKLWGLYYGVAAPSFLYDRQGRAATADVKYTTQWVGLPEHFKSGVFNDVQDEVWCGMLQTIYNDFYDVTAVSLARFGSSLEQDVVNIRHRFAADLVPFAARLCLPHEIRLSRFLVRGRSVETTPIFSNTIRTRTRGGELYTCTADYGARGHLVMSDVLAPVGQSCVEVCVSDTDFCTSRVRLTTYDPTYVDRDFGNWRRSQGHFWLTPMRLVGSIAPAYSPALRGLFAKMAIVEVKVEDDIKKEQNINNIGRVGAARSDPGQIISPSSNVYGNLPVHEAGVLTLQEFAKSLVGLDPGVQQKLVDAFLRGGSSNEVISSEPIINNGDQSKAGGVS